MLSELLVESSDSLVSGSLSASSDLLGLELVELLGLDLSLGLELLDNVTLGPAGEGRDISKLAVVSVGLHSQDSEGLGHNHSLLVVVGEGNSLEHLQLLEGGGTTGRLVGEHASHGLPEHARGGGEVLESTAGVSVDSFVLSSLPSELVSEERS